MENIYAALQSSVGLVRTRESVRQCLPQRLATHGQVVPSRTIQAEQGRRDDLSDELQRLLQGGVDVAQIAGRSHLNDLQHKAEKVVRLEKLGRIEDAAEDIVEINAREGVDFTHVAADAAELGVLRNHGDGVEVQLNEAVVDGSVVPVLWDLLVALSVLKGAVAAVVNAEEGLQNLMCWIDG